MEPTASMPWSCQTRSVPEPSSCAGKYEWPELVGRNGLEAKMVIESENPSVTLVIIRRYPDIAPPDFCCNRVEVWVDEDGKVISTPIIS